MALSAEQLSFVNIIFQSELLKLSNRRFVQSVEPTIDRKSDETNYRVVIGSSEDAKKFAEELLDQYGVVSQSKFSRKSEPQPKAVQKDGTNRHFLVLTESDIYLVCSQTDYILEPISSDNSNKLTL